MSGVEVVAAFGALSSFLQVVEFTTKVVKQAYELNRSGLDALRENIETERLARDYEWLGTISQDVANDPNRSREELAIAKIGQECHAEAQRLLRKLEDLRVNEGSKGVRRALESARQAARAGKKRKEIEHHRKYLQELNGQLSTALLQAFWRKQGQRTEDENSVALVTQLAEVKTERDSEITGHILQSLHFPDIDLRCGIVKQAYPDTYQWAIDDESFGLRTWLLKGDGIFWISGKAGSGKSTLLKFLYHSADTRVLLQEWCSDQELVTGSFYFWFLGSEFQKSTEGLLRTILFQILSERPALARVAFPVYFNSEEPSSERPIHWTHNALVDGLHAIAGHENNGKSKKFCLFVDGLDEYHGNHIELIVLLKTLASNTDIKLCVTSRPWTAFRRAFDTKVPSLRLEDLSFPDIQLYVDGSIRGIVSELASSEEHDEDEDEDENEADDSQVASLVHEIAIKAEGVFLWVFLVVRSVLAGLAEGDSLSMLRRRVAEFPSDLEKFFRQILDRVDNVYREHTAQALKLALLSANSLDRDGTSKSWINFWLIGRQVHGLRDIEIVYELDVQEKPRTAWSKMLNETQIFTSAACKDLAVTPQAFAYLDPNVGNVEFLHRTVYEFLNGEEMQLAIDERVPDHFKNGRINHLLNLARLHFTWPGRSLSSVDDILNDLAVASLKTQHYDGYEKFAAHLESIVLQYLVLFSTKDMHLETSAKLHLIYGDNISAPAVILPLIAFGRNECASKILKLISERSSTFTSYPRLGLGSVIQAALGYHSFHRFGLEQISLTLLETVLKFTDVSSFVKEESRYPHLYQAWHAFLSQWASSQPPIMEAHGLRHAWKITELFLANSISTKGGVSLLDSWLYPHEVGDVEGCTAKAFIENRVPLVWLKELDWDNI